jgi:tetratricopeptide (TPR) repeat protein
MTDSFKHVPQNDLLQLGLAAMQRNDDASAVVYLKEAADRPDASAPALFLLGSLYAQLRMVGAAIETMTRAVDVDPGYVLARFQLGMLHLTSGHAEAALVVWEPLRQLAEDDAFRVWRDGMEHLIRDEFDAAIQCLREGLLLNTENEALSRDMRMLMERIEAREWEPEAAAKPAAATPTQEESSELDNMSHLFLSVYTKGRTH